MPDREGPLLPGGRRPTESWESLIDRKIRAGMDTGEFGNLPGEGKPLDLDDNPLEDPTWRTARRMLKSAGFSHPAIEAKRALERDIDAGRSRLSRSGAGRAEVRAWCDEVNRRVRDHNLRWPQSAMWIAPLEAAAEPRTVAASDAPATS
jgi:hypothetical protein